MDEVAAYEQSSSLTDAQKAALRLHQAFLTDPAGLRPEVRAQVLAHFYPAQIAELAFKFIWWSTNRATVTLGNDAQADASGLTWFHYTELGEYVPHEAGVT